MTALIWLYRGALVYLLAPLAIDAAQAGQWLACALVLGLLAILCHAAGD